MSEDLATREYSQAQISLTGKMVLDKVCLQQNSGCVELFEFLGVTEMKGLPESVGGVLGLAIGVTPQGSD